jgi:hypothetical protein
MWAALKNAIMVDSDDRRVAPRVSAKGTVRIDSRSYPLVNWSTSGVLLGGHTDHLAKGQRFRMSVIVDDKGEPIEFDAEAIVARVQGDKLAAQFLFIDKYKKARIHKYFANQNG